MSASVPAATLTDRNQPIRLRIWNQSGVSEDILLIKHVSGTETMCGGIEYHLLCVATRVGMPLKEFIANPVELQFVTDTGDLRSVCGIVAEAAEGQSDGGLATYQLIVRDAFALLDKTCNTRVFLNLNEVDITAILLKEWRTANPVAATVFEYDLRNLKSYPAREFTMQYNESTAAFLRRLWKRRGIAWFVSAGSSTETRRDHPPVHTLVLFDDAWVLKKNVAGTIRFHRDDATETRDTITAWHAVRTLTSGVVTRHSWDVAQVRMVMSHETGLNDQGSFGNRLAAGLDDYLIDSPHTASNGADYLDLGRARIQRHVRSQVFSR